MNTGVIRRALSSPSAWWRYLALAGVAVLVAPFLLTSQWGQSAITFAIEAIPIEFLSAEVNRAVWNTVV